MYTYNKIDVYDLIASRYNAKPKNVIPYFSSIGFDHIVGNNELWSYIINPLQFNKDLSSGLNVNNPYFFGEYVFSFFMLTPINANFSFRPFVYDVTDLSVGSRQTFYNIYRIFAYDTAGVQGINFPDFQLGSNYYFNKYNSPLRLGLNQGLRLIYQTDVAGEIQLRMTLQFSGFLINFK